MFSVLYRICYIEYIIFIRRNFENEKDVQLNRENEVRSAVYNVLADVSFHLDVNEEEMNKALEWFQTHFMINI